MHSYHFNGIFETFALIMFYEFHYYAQYIIRLEFYERLQWRIQGGGYGGYSPPPLC